MMEHNSVLRCPWCFVVSIKVSVFSYASRATLYPLLVIKSAEFRIIVALRFASLLSDKRIKFWRAGPCGVPTLIIFTLLLPHLLAEHIHNVWHRRPSTKSLCFDIFGPPCRPLSVSFLFGGWPVNLTAKQALWRLWLEKSRSGIRIGIKALDQSAGPFNNRTWSGSSIGIKVRDQGYRDQDSGSMSSSQAELIALNDLCQSDSEF